MNEGMSKRGDEGIKKVKIEFAKRGRVTEEGWRRVKA